jgi:small subunit ribosomal protein S18
MAKAKSTRRVKPKNDGRRGKKKISPISGDSLDYVDYKDVDLLRRFLSDRAKIRGRHASGNDSQQQRVISVAIKNAREMGLLPYASRVTTQRRGRNDRGDRPERGPRRDDSDRSDSTSDFEVSDEFETAAMAADATVGATEGED